MADARVDHRDPPPPTKASFPSKDDTVKERMVKATVARGRSYMISKGRRVVGYHEITRDPFYAPICEYVDEFQEIELTESDAAFGRARGYLIDPTAQAPMKSEGPSFTELRPPQAQGPTYGR